MSTATERPSLQKAIPEDLRSREQWVVWKTVERDGSPTKLPYQTNGDLAKSNDASTWTDFETAVKGASEYQGVGFMFSDSDDFCGIDLDGCRDPKTGHVSDWAKQIVMDFNTYAEVSPSETGIKLFLRGKSPFDRGRKVFVKDAKQICEKKPGIEIYDRKRYFVVTGRKLQGMPSECRNCGTELTALCERYFPNPKPRDHHAGNGHIEHDQKIKRARAYLAKVPPAISGSGGHNQTFAAACSLILGFDLKVSEALPLLLEYNHDCAPPWTEAELLHKLEDADKKTDPRGYLLGDDRSEKVCTRVQTSQSLQPTTDLGNCRRLVALHGRDLHYLPPWKRWVTWTGSYWQEDEACSVERYAKSVPPAILRDASQAGDDEQQKALASWAIRSQSAERLRAMVTLARSEPGIPILPGDLDSDPWLLNVANGTLDLRTGELRAHRREDLITRCIPIPYDPEAKRTRWLRFLDEVFEGDPYLTEFVKRSLGYCLTGDTRERCLFFLHGKGKNGKSTLINTVQNILGDYATSITIDLLTVRRSDVHPTEVCDLAGRRLAVASETEEGRRLAESFVKTLTGGTDKMKGRRLHQDFWQFDMTAKLWMFGNHKPKIRGTDDGIWDRVKLIPFHSRFWDPKDGETGPDHLKIDKNLNKNLAAEAPGILAWMVEGCLAWQQDGLAEPDTVRHATGEYRKDSDVIGKFISETCTLDEHARCKAADLYNAYGEWVGNPRETLGKRQFGEAMSERGFERKNSAGWHYLGIDLAESF